jgi:hypothetical protein
MKYKLKDIKPNPFRNIDNYPINKEKVAALRESIGQTGFWDNVVARQYNGHPEIAYGHHRMSALREEYGPNHTIELILRPLSDEDMIKIMARENMEEWGSNAQIEMETVKAVVQAFAEGKIKLKAVSSGKGTQVGFRCAPSFLKVGSNGISSGDRRNVYNAQTVAEFIGWVNRDGRAADKVHTALNALELAEKGALDESDLSGIGSEQASELVSAAGSTLKWREKSRMPQTAIPKAREVSQKIAKKFRENKERRGAKRIASSIRFDVDRRQKQKPWLKQFVDRLNTQLFHMLSSRDKITEMILEILKVIDDVDKETRVELETQLRNLATRSRSLADMVKSGKGVTKKELVPLLRA